MNGVVTVLDKEFELLIPKAVLDEKIKDLADQLNAAYAGFTTHIDDRYTQRILCFHGRSGQTFKFCMYGSIYPHRILRWPGNYRSREDGIRCIPKMER